MNAELGEEMFDVVSDSGGADAKLLRDGRGRGTRGEKANYLLLPACQVHRGAGGRWNGRIGPPGQRELCYVGAKLLDEPLQFLLAVGIAEEVYQEAQLFSS